MKHLLLWALSAAAATLTAGVATYIYLDVQARHARQRVTFAVEPEVEVAVARADPMRPFPPMLSPAERWGDVEGQGGSAAASDAPEITAEEELDRQLTELAQTGAGGDELLPEMQAMSGLWLAQALQRGMSVQLSTWACFKGGCVLTYSQPPDGTGGTFSEIVSQSPEFSQWSGGRFESGPTIWPDGRQEATWIFYAPTS